jgi:anti-sigma regulatory factor (Ser/Thr protein kinase)
VQESECDFSGDAENVRAARRFVSETAERWDLGDQAWPLVQIVSELASNAIIHAGTDFTVRMRHEGDETRIEVLDRSARKARSRRYDLDATTGRGLRLVETLSRDWGVAREAEGKIVWAVVDRAASLDVESEALADAFLDVALDEHADEIKATRSKPRRGRTAQTVHRLAA